MTSAQYEDWIRAYYVRRMSKYELACFGDEQ
jgi:hypothetical protein